MGFVLSRFGDHSFQRRRRSGEKKERTVAVEKCLGGRERERVWSDVINKALTRRQLHLQFFMDAVGRRFQPPRQTEMMEEAPMFLLSKEKERRRSREEELR